jgi:TRAP-type C4-dicarboxylate transport system permease small subunit
MKPFQIIGLFLVVAGVLAMAYGGFSYTKETHDIELGPLEISVEEKERVNIPLWAGAALAIGGAVLLVAARPRS